MTGVTCLELWGIGHDITALENISNELELILRSMPFAILVWNEDGTIINSNEKFEEYFGIKKNEIIGQKSTVWSKNILKDIKVMNDAGYMEAKVYYDESKDSLRILKSKRCRSTTSFTMRLAGCVSTVTSQRKENWKRRLSEVLTPIFSQASIIDGVFISI